MTFTCNSRTPRAALALLAIIVFLVLLQTGAFVSDSLADIGGAPGSTAVTPDVASDVVAATGGEFRVAESGGATYSIPLYVVPGTAGVGPQLALNYSSQGGNGPLGRGWAISGLSAISRCRASREAGDFVVAGVATDGNPRPINFSSSDQFCLDGQRLIPAQSSSAACLAVAGMTASNLRTEAESFQRVCAYAPTSGTNGPAFFSVDRQDGSRSWYGDRNNDSSANRPDGYLESTAPGKTSMALAWAQTRLQDSTGNYIDFLYLKNPSGAGNGEQLISEVRYTGKTLLPGQSGSALAPYAKVVFSYSSLGTATGKSWIAGGALTQSQRLESITSCAAADPGPCATSTQVRFYQLAYAAGIAGNVLERLVSVQECRDSTKAVCLPATTFAWSQLTPGSFDTQESSGSIPNGSLSKFEGLKFGDVDGDGRMDLIWLKDGQSGETCSTDSVYVAFARIDATGKPFFTIGNPVLCTPADLAWDPADGSWFMLDYDGDGRDDLFLRGQTRWLGYRAIGDATTPFITSVDLLVELAEPIPAGAARDAEPQHADVNGDGLIDLVYSTGSGLVVRVMERGGSHGYRWGNARPVALTTDTCTSNCFTLSGLYRKNNYQQLNDFDGDSRSDLLVNVEVTCSGTNDPPPREPFPIYIQSTETSDEATAASTCVRMMPFVVENLTASALTLRRYGTSTSSLGESFSFADINGDGLSDMIVHGITTAIPSFSINTGMDFVGGGNLGFGVSTSQVQAVDVNGDGRSDIVYTSSDYTHFVARYGRADGTVSDAVPLGNLSTGCGTLSCFAGRSFLFSDVDGDGNVDFMRIKWDDSQSPVYFSRASAANRQLPRDAITTITNGLGAQTLITYAPLTNMAVYRADVGSRNASLWGRGSPVQDLKAPMYVVARAASSSPQAGAPDAMATVHYRYAGAKVQAGGRGLLGFREIVTIDPNQSGGYVTTQTLYHQQFPLTAMPAQTFKRAVAGSVYAVPDCLNGVMNDSCYSTPGFAFPTPAGSLFTENSQVWESDTDIVGTAVTAYSSGVQAPVHVRTAGTVEKLRDPFNGATTSRIESSFSYAAYGNLAVTSVDTFNGDSSASMSTIITSSTWSDTPAAWRLARLAGTTITHRRPSRSDVVRTSSFAYASGTGLLQQERQQAGGPVDQDYLQEHSLDSFGNRLLSITCAAPVTNCTTTGLLMRPVSDQTIKRYARTVFDSRGRFPMATYEPFEGASGTVEKSTLTVIARNVFGDVTQAHDVNGVDTLAVAGTFGRPYYTWTETVPGSIPGASADGIDSTVTYRRCGTGGVDCPAGAVFRQKVISDAAPRQWTWFDVLGRPLLKASETFNVSVSGKDVSAVCTNYDAAGRPNRVSTPFFLSGTGGADGPTGLGSICTSSRAWNVTYYDVLGRPTDAVSADGSIVSNDYSGLVTIITDQRGNTTTQTRNAKGELTRVTDANAMVMTYAYWADGNVLNTVRDAGRGPVENKFYYDAVGRKELQIDPDTGSTRFRYNAMGELILQIDVNDDRLEQSYDARGRIWRKTVKNAAFVVESQAIYNHDTAANGLGQLHNETISGTYAGLVGESGTALGYNRAYSYDSLGRPLGSTTVIDSQSFAAAVHYDALGRPWKAQDASGRWAKTAFNPRGMIEAVCESSGTDTWGGCPADAGTYQRTLETDQWGNTLKERRGNSAAMDITRTFWGSTGRAASICAGDATSCNLVKELYAWDNAGNLSTQQKEGRYLEQFTYDNLNRLRTGTLTMEGGVAVNKLVQSFEYDKLGNLCRKTGTGVDVTYAYTGRSGCGLGGANSLHGGGGTGTMGAHQVRDLNGVFYYYDLHGNQTVMDAPGTSADRTIKYSLDDKAYEATSGSTRTRFWYGSDGARYKRMDGSKLTLYLGNVEVVTDAGVTTVKRTVAGVMLQTIVGSTVTSHYLFHDHLGSLAKLTNAAGAAINSQDHAAFGARRSYTDPNSAGSAPTLTTRGFTGHEMVDGVLGLIHMNGRIFDPRLGRFLQADPFIQAPDNTQSWNAYTYVFNNPYRYTDPSGNLGLEERQWLGAIITIAAAMTGQYWAAGATTVAGGNAIMLGTMAVGGFAGGAVATQSLRGGLMGAYFAVASAGIGGIGGGSGGFGTWALQTAAGGVMGSLQGGGFGHSFLSAGLSAGLMPHLGHIGNNVGRTVAGALVGGTISRVTGGKFANGAVSGAIQAAMAGGGRRAAATDRQQWGPEIASLKEAAIAEGELAMQAIRTRSYTDLDALAIDTADALQPVTDRLSTEVAVRFFQDGDFFVAGSVTSDGQLCSGFNCGVNPRLSVGPGNGRTRVAGFLHTHPRPSPFSGDDLAFSWSERRRAGINQRAYVSRPDGRIYSFNSSVVGTIPGVSTWDGYVNYANRVR